MFIGLFRFLYTRWRHLTSSIHSFWAIVTRLVSARPLYPPTPEQLRAEVKRFTDVISQDAILALASRYNNNLPCRLRDGTSQGSFNICFYVDFFTVGTIWVVRVAIEPAVCQAWDKLQSEVYTMQCEPIILATLCRVECELT